VVAAQPWHRQEAAQKAVIDRGQGRCVGREADGNECQWGTVTAEPPLRLVVVRHRRISRSSISIRHDQEVEFDSRPSRAA
jgi:hypothetical protein